MKRTFFPFGLIFGALCITCIAACSKPSGPKRIPVSGKVILDGKPVAVAAISFQPAAGVTGPAANGSITKGTYHLTKDSGPVSGNHHVDITLPPIKGGPMPNARFHWDFDVIIPENGPFEKDFILD